MTAMHLWNECSRLIYDKQIYDMCHLLLRL